MTSEPAHRLVASLERRDDAPAMARHLVQDALSAADVPVDAAEAALLVSELVTNAVVHTDSGEVRLEVVIDPAKLRCVVTDEAPSAPPSVRPDDPSTVGGLGMVIVDSVASRWGHQHDAAHKSVWFELDVV